MAIEATKDVRDIPACDPLAIVTDSDLGVEGILAVADLDPPSLWGMLDAVFDYVGERLRAPVEVAGKACICLAMDLKALFLDLKRDLQRLDCPLH